MLILTLPDHELTYTTTHHWKNRIGKCSLIYAEWLRHFTAWWMYFNTQQRHLIDTLFVQGANATVGGVPSRCHPRSIQQRIDLKLTPRVERRDAGNLCRHRVPLLQFLVITTLVATLRRRRRRSILSTAVVLLAVEDVAARPLTTSAPSLGLARRKASLEPWKARWKAPKHGRAPFSSCPPAPVVHQTTSSVWRAALSDAVETNVSVASTHGRRITRRGSRTPLTFLRGAFSLRRRRSIPFDNIWPGFWGRFRRLCDTRKLYYLLFFFWLRRKASRNTRSLEIGCIDREFFVLFICKIAISVGLAGGWWCGHRSILCRAKSWKSQGLVLWWNIIYWCIHACILQIYITVHLWNN